MKILGADLSAERMPGREARALVLVDDAGHVQVVRRAASLTEVTAATLELSRGETFLLAVNLPLVVPAGTGKVRPVEQVVKRRLGHRLVPGGRGAMGSDRAGVAGVAGEALLAALAAAGQPCLPYPDRDRRTSSLAEVHEGLVLKALLWEGSTLTSGAHRPDSREPIFLALEAPGYGGGGRTPRAARPWTDGAVAMDLVLRALGRPEGYDLQPAREALAEVDSEPHLQAASAVLHACLLAGTARRYLESPEACLFLGDREGGYTILPADAFVRRLASREGRRAAKGQLFPKSSLRDHLGGVATLQSPDLLDVPGRAQRVEAAFHEPPLYEFDNLDEMLWWKHCRHVAGPALPVDGLQEMLIALEQPGQGASERLALRLVRSRHRTLSFRFEPPQAWRVRVAPRDGRTYPFRIVRATYQISRSLGA